MYVAEPMTYRILVVEDDTDISELLKKMLEKEGYLVSQAFSGTEARLCVKNVEPDLILLDLMLPGMPGEEFLKCLREEEQDNTPLLVLSAKNSLEDKVTLLGIGADDYITKPFEPKEVVARVQAALRRSHQNQEKVFSRESLYEQVWKEGYYGTDHTVNVHVSNLRKKIKELDPDQEYIQGVYGIGFRLAKS